MPMPDAVVIIGAGHAGGAAALALREAGHSGPITLIGEEAHPPYERPSLSKELLSGEAAEPVWLADAARWGEADVVMRLGVRATEIDLPARRVRLVDGGDVAYDRLVLATGGSPRPLPIPGGDTALSLRDWNDTSRLAARMGAARRVIVFGGGVIGLEVASTLAGADRQVTVLEAGPRVLGRNVPEEAARWLVAAHAREGVVVRTGAAADAIRDGRTVVLAGGETLEADLVVSGIGIDPATELAEAAGLLCDGGVVVDRRYRSVTDPAIYAIGDLAARRLDENAPARRMETWAHAASSARAAARAILDLEPDPEEVPWFWTAQCGHTLQIAGDCAAGDAAVARGDRVRLFLRDGVLVGAACLDQPRDFAAARRLIASAARLDPAKAAAGDLRAAVLR